MLASDRNQTYFPFTIIHKNINNNCVVPFQSVPINIIRGVYIETCVWCVCVCVAHSNTYMHSHLGRLPARGKAVAVAVAIAVAFAAVQFTVYDATAKLAKCANAM